MEKSEIVAIEKPMEKLTKKLEDFPLPLTEKYEPLEFLGEGGFARVFKAKRKSDGEIVAIKIPRLDEKTSSIFLKEIASWYHLNHPNIVRLYSADILPVPYMEMEYVEGVKISGKTVRDLERYPKPVSEDIALSIVKGVADGLKHAHDKGIYHLDLKPLNVLIKSDLTPKITDWGLAKISARSSSTANIGYSPLYAAPEQIDEKKFGQPDHRTDIYGLGVILYELLTGKLPYEAMTPSAVLGKIVAENIKPDPVSKHNPALAKFDGLIEKLLAKRKEDRFQSVDEVLSALDSMKSYKMELEELKKSLEDTKTSLRKSRSKEEMDKLQKEAVEKTAKIAILAARLNDKPEVLNALEELKLFTKQNLEDLLGAVSSVELMIKEGIPIGDEFIERLRVLLSRIKREFKVGE
ncbi:MAG: protein kinase [Archaeoglobaceae archaeon]